MIVAFVMRIKPFQKNQIKKFKFQLSRLKNEVVCASMLNHYLDQLNGSIKWKGRVKYVFTDSNNFET